MLISVMLYALVKLYLIFNIYQQSHYQFKFYFKHFVYNLLFYDLFPILVLCISLIENLLMITVICSIYLLLFSLFYLLARVRLKFTKRIRRLMLISIFYLGIGFIPCVGPYLLIFIEFSIFPVLLLERMISYGLNLPYLKKAKKRMETFEGNTIAITGSYGKTSTKVLLNQALNIFHSANATPKSYNTELGVSRFINECADLNIYDDLILEFGASHVKDISHLCELASPDIAFVTGIGHMHIETFGNIENIIAEKMSIIKGCKTVVLNYECDYIRNYALPKDIHYISYGFHFGDYCAKNIKQKEFDFYIKDKFIAHFKTNLVGKHQILNLTGVLAYLYEIGVDLDVLKRGVLTFQSEKNRLEVKKMNTYTLLDDSFNSNYQGFTEALNILRNHPKKRIVLTPGMVELGKYKKELLNMLVEYLASSADIIILIGYFQTKYLYNLLKQFNKEVYLVRNFMEGYRLFMMLTEVYKDSMLLIENDLPDLYRIGLI